MMQKIKKQAEILYEENSSIPFIKTDNETQMPKILFIWEMKENGFEEQADGSILPIVDAELTQYFSVNEMKKRLDEKTFDVIRVALGLKPLKEAIEDGKTISQKARNAIKELEKDNVKKEEN